MRIYVFLEYYPSPYKSYFDTQFDLFVRAGHELSIFAFGKHQVSKKNKAIRLGLNEKVTYVPNTLKSHPKFMGAILRAVLENPPLAFTRTTRNSLFQSGIKKGIYAFSRASLLPSKPPDICLVHNLIALTRFDFIAKIYPEAPLVLYYHGGELPGVPKLSATKTRNAFSIPDKVFTNTEFSRTQAIARGCDPNKITLHPIGFDMEEFPPLRFKQRKPGTPVEIISVGRLSEEKGIEYAMHALSLIKKDAVFPFRYKIVGKGPSEIALRNLSRDIGIDDYVKFCGQIEDRLLLYRMIAEADILLLPSIPIGYCAETQACSVQEAMMLGTLVLTTDCGGIKESIPIEMMPYNVRPRDPDGIAIKLVEMNALPIEEKIELSTTCREFVQRHYKMEDLNRSILKCAKNRQPANLHETNAN